MRAKFKVMVKGHKVMGVRVKVIWVFRVWVRVKVRGKGESGGVKV